MKTDFWIGLSNKEYLNKVGINLDFYNNTVRPRILEKWNYKCSSCFKHHNKLHLHHKDYENQNINTIKPLCPSCHKKEHHKLKKLNNKIILGDLI